MALNIIDYRERMNKIGLTYAELSGEVGLSAQYIGKILCGAGHPSFTTEQALRRAIVIFEQKTKSGQRIPRRIIPGKKPSYPVGFEEKTQMNKSLPFETERELIRKLYKAAGRRFTRQAWQYDKEEGFLTMINADGTDYFWYWKDGTSSAVDMDGKIYTAEQTARIFCVNLNAEDDTKFKHIFRKGEL